MPTPTSLIIGQSMLLISPNRWNRGLQPSLPVIKIKPNLVFGMHIFLTAEALLQVLNPWSHVFRSRLNRIYKGEIVRVKENLNVRAPTFVGEITNRFYILMLMKFIWLYAWHNICFENFLQVLTKKKKRKRKEIVVKIFLLVIYSDHYSNHDLMMI